MRQLHHPNRIGLHLLFRKRRTWILPMVDHRSLGLIISDKTTATTPKESV